MMKQAIAGIVALAAILLTIERGVAQTPAAMRIHATTPSDVRTWDAFVSAAVRSGALRVRGVDRDPSTPSETIERLDQYHRGVRIWGADVVRNSDQGVARWLFGSLSPELTMSVEPSIGLPAARDRLIGAGGTDALILRQPELVVLPLPNGDHRLAYTAVVSGNRAVFRIFIDASSGAELLRYSSIHTQAAIGAGRGVLGDT